MGFSQFCNFHDPIWYSNTAKFDKIYERSQVLFQLWMRISFPFLHAKDLLYNNNNNNNNNNHYHKRIGACLIPNGSVYIELGMNCCALFTRLNSSTDSSDVMPVISGSFLSR